jgi:hypothetical protein
MAGTEGPAAYDPTRYWVIGTFLGHDVHEVSGKTIYTEIHLRIDSVLGTHEKPNSPKVGSVIDFGIGGGCIKATNGEVHDFYTGFNAKESRQNNLTNYFGFGMSE